MARFESSMRWPSNTRTGEGVSQSVFVLQFNCYGQFVLFISFKIECVKAIEEKEREKNEECCCVELVIGWNFFIKFHT